MKSCSTKYQCQVEQRTPYGVLASHTALNRKFTYLLRVTFLIILLLSLSSAHELQAQVSTPAPQATAEPIEAQPTDAPLTAQPSSSPAEVSAPELIPRTIEERADALIAQMTPEDLVGQLFVITFEGNDTSPHSNIAELIYKYRVGGVVISPQTKNFINDKPGTTPIQVATLVNQLQGLAYGVPISASQALSLTVDIDATAATLHERNETFADLAPLQIPLLIGVQQLGDSLPGTMLRSGFTPLPSQLALGATWKPDLVEQVGGVVGRELRAVGVNMLLGPNLDVLEQPLSESVRSLGVYSFGGNPYWVSKLGRAYIAGVHLGSDGRVITIARHFPGQGGSDRLPRDEVATIQSDIEFLERNTFRPFFDVTQPISRNLTLETDPTITDGLMSSHMHFRNIEGADLENATPISLDNNQLASLLQHESYAAWRTNGILMSDALGVKAIRRYYESSGGEFQLRQVAFSAFDAGHDLLYLNGFGATENISDTISASANITDTILAFRRRYINNDDFKVRVDNAVRRILRLKLRMYEAPFVNQLENGTLVTPNEAPTTTTTDTADEIKATAQLTATQLLSETQPITPSIPLSDTINDGESATSNDATLDSAATAGGDQTENASVSNAQTTTSQISATVTSTLTALLTDTLHIPLSRVFVQYNDLAVFQKAPQDESAALMRQVASESLTILKPEPSSGESPVDPLPPPLKAGEVMLILTDSRLLDDCEKCLPDGGIGPDNIKNIINELYGIEGTGQLTGNQVTSHAFVDLNKILEETPECAAGGPLSEGADAVNSEADKVATSVEEVKETETQEVDPTQETAERIDEPTRLERDLHEADWIIFAMLDVDTQKYCESDVVSRFLAERSEQLQGKKVIVLALNAPYFLDVTDISKLSAYLGVYSKTEPFLRSTVNVLFGNYQRNGAVPINVPGTRFSDLNERLQPDPERIPPMEVLLVASNVVTPLITAGEDTTLPKVNANSTIRLRVGPILDWNGHPVPDGTTVEFELRYPDEDVAPPIEPKGTEGRHCHTRYSARP